MATNPLAKSFQDFPIPRLDDRTTRELMEEMRSLLPIYCPEWTNYNPSDPGMTILEMFAWLTETMLYRINRVPARNLFALLDLLGVQPRPPAPARALVQVSPNPGAGGGILPAGVAVSARRGGEGERLIFETEAPLLLTTATLTRVLASSGLHTRDVTRELGVSAFEPFAGDHRAPHLLYVGDARISSLKEPGVRVHLRFAGPSAHRDIYARWRFELFDGQGWAPAPLAVAHGRGEVILTHAAWLRPASVEGVPVWLRMVHLPEEEATEAITFSDLSLEVESIDEGVLPEATFLGPGGEILLTRLDVSRVFYPLGHHPRRESSVYVLSRELMRVAGTRVELCFAAPLEEDYPRPEATADLTLRLEYPIPGGRWSTLGVLTPGVLAAEDTSRVDDTTRALRREGTVAFVVPPDLVPCEVQGIVGPWLRLRLSRGAYLPPANAPRPDPSSAYAPPVEPVGPAFEALLIRGRSPSSPASGVYVHSDSTWRPLWEGGQARGLPVQLFPLRQGHARALYVALDEPLPPGRVGLYLRLGDGRHGGHPSRWRRLAWEVDTGEGFTPLAGVEDTTDGLNRDGFVRFEAPSPHPLTTRFGHTGRWLRLRLVEGELDPPPLIQDLRLNLVPAQCLSTHRDGRVLPSDGMPGQEIQLQRAPVVGEVRLWVREDVGVLGVAQRLSLTQELGEGALLEHGGELWCRWRQVDHFFHAGPGSRCFRLDPHGGVVRFGDGIRGRIPPPGGRAIRVESYPVGGGARGNVGPHTLTQLRESNSLVQSIDNPWSADGGADAEGLEEAAQRGVRRMFITDRAWSAGDYAALAREASRRVARVTCLEPTRVGRPMARRRGASVRPAERGPVEVVILPERAPGEGPGARLAPSAELLARVDTYLQARRTLGSRIQVRGPGWRPLVVRCSVYLRAEGQGVEDDITLRLRRYLDALEGGEDGRGWPLGRAVRRSALFQVASASPFVLSLRELSLFEVDGEPLSSTVTLARDQLPALLEVKVSAEILR